MASSYCPTTLFSTACSNSGSLFAVCPTAASGSSTSNIMTVLLTMAALLIYPYVGIWQTVGVEGWSDKIF